ncbi:MAG: hypothetical protein ABIG96_00200 [Candidatus Micrarchaeota archaeon]
MGITYRIGRNAFNWFYSNIITAYTKPVSAAVALLWAYFAASQINGEQTWNLFYAYAAGQILYFVYFGYLRIRYGKGGFFEIFERNQKERWGILSTIISYPRALVFILTWIFMPLGLVIFTLLNAFFIIGSVVGVILPNYEGALLTLCIFLLLFAWAIVSWFEHRKRKEALVSEKVKKVGWIGKFQHRFGELLTDEEKKKLEE